MTIQPPAFFAGATRIPSGASVPMDLSNVVRIEWNAYDKHGARVDCGVAYYLKVSVSKEMPLGTVIEYRDRNSGGLTRAIKAGSDSWYTFGLEEGREVARVTTHPTVSLENHIDGTGFKVLVQGK